MSPLCATHRRDPLVPVCALVLVLGCLVGCDQVLGLADPSCGDGVLLDDEACDDGNGAADDGCGPTCQIELGFECRAVGEACLPVVGLTRGAITTELPAVGDPGGNPYAFECPPGEVVFGFEGFANELAPPDNLSNIRVVCASLGLTPDGDAVLTRSSQSEYYGGAPFGPMLTVTCAPNEIATGFVPNINTYVSGFQLSCQAVAHTGGSLRFGEPRLVEMFGPAKGIEAPPQSCALREAVSAVAGTAGAFVDSMGIGCSPLSTVLCGDGVLTAPEQCDDGNLSRADGCDGRCQLE